ncbi:hypothetical protein LZ32DRAFT_174406 [Colletotrichum eremochloae]|nr:hypothetical protein LZ32DRAFT_174406 [Colletotrichum eremochloae]
MDRSQISKRRGRPRKPAAPYNPDEEVSRYLGGFQFARTNTGKRRRSQLRRAQIAFRARKQETDKAREERLVILENMVEQMGHAFSELADYIIGSEVCKEDSGILGKLAATTAQVLALSRDTHDHEPTGEPSVLERNSAPLTQQDSLLSATMYDGLLTPSSADTDQALHANTMSSNRYEDNRNIAVEYYDVLTVQNPFGNGWFGLRPRLLSGHQFSNGFWSPDRTSFAFRLLTRTLQIAYWTLVGAIEDSTTLYNRMFRFALLYHDKSELQFNLRWFLGPGIAESHILMGRNLDAKPSIAKTNGDLLNPGVDVAAVAAAAAAAEVSQISWGPSWQPAYELFATVKDVDEYLRERGARHVDSETIELAFPLQASLATTFDASIPLSPSPHIEQNHFSASSQKFDSAPNVLKIFDFNTVLQPGLGPQRQHNFLTTENITNVKETHPAATTQRIRVQTLFQHLAGVSVCLGQGPAFQRGAIDEAISAAITSD